MALPDYTVSVWNKTTDQKSGNIGAGWKQPDGRIQIRLNPGAALLGGLTDQVITLFPYTAKPAATPAPVRRPKPQQEDWDDFDADIPF